MRWTEIWLNAINLLLNHKAIVVCIRMTTDERIGERVCALKSIRLGSNGAHVWIAIETLIRFIIAVWTIWILRQFRIASLSLSVDSYCTTREQGSSQHRVAISYTHALFRIVALPSIHYSSFVSWKLWNSCRHFILLLYGFDPFRKRCTNELASCNLLLLFFLNK